MADEEFRFITLHAADATIRLYKKSGTYHDEDLKTCVYRLLREQLPNGNWVFYEYTQRGSKLGRQVASKPRGLPLATPFVFLILRELRETNRGSFQAAWRPSFEPRWVYTHEYKSYDLSSQLRKLFGAQNRPFCPL